MGSVWIDGVGAEKTMSRALFNSVAEAWKRSIPQTHRNVWWKVILYNNTKRSAQWLDKNEAPKHFPKPEFHKKKCMVTVWWTAKGIVHFSFLKPGETIRLKILSVVRLNAQKVARKTAWLNRNGPILFHNVRPHVARLTQTKLNNLGIEVLPHYHILLTPLIQTFCLLDFSAVRILILHSWHTRYF